MIDLHCHILPGLDDGAADLDESLAIARAAARDGVRTIAATPHVSSTYDAAPADVAQRTDRLAADLEAAGVPISVVPGAEVALTRIPELGDELLAGLCLGGSRCLLVESPYAARLDGLEEVLLGLRDRGFRPLLAHPERCPLFHADRARIEGLVEEGVMCSVTAPALAGDFGGVVQRFALRLVADGLAHGVASDGHDPRRRPPTLGRAFRRADAWLPGFAAQAGWYAEAAPSALLADAELPERPAPPPWSPRLWARLTARP